MDANLNVIRDYIENSYGNNSGRNAARAAVDALSQLARPVPHHRHAVEYTAHKPGESWISVAAAYNVSAQ
jgi:ribosomal protein S5